MGKLGTTTTTSTYTSTYTRRKTQHRTCHPSVRTQHTTFRVELTEAEAVPAKALRSTAAADARVASFMVDVELFTLF